MNEYRLIWERLEGRSGHEAGRQLLKQLYREETGQELPEISLGPWGKPYFVNSDLPFSISNTKNHAICALSSRPIGIDAEETDRNINLRLADKILSPAERPGYDAAEDKHAALLKLWVLKEASVKRTGEGLQGYPRHTDFSPDDPRVQEIDGCWVAILTD